MPPEPSPPVLGRASPASSRPSTLRPAADAAVAAYRADGGDGSGWALRAATVAGVRHRLAGLGPEDAYAWRVVGGGTAPDGHEPLPGGGTVVVAVADGVGSVEGSAAAATAAVEAVCGALGDALTGGADRPRPQPGDDLWRHVFADAGTAVRRAGGATTLVVAVVAGDPLGCRSGAVARVGDSTALILAGGGWSELWPAPGADDGPVSTATAALSERPGDPVPEVVAFALGPDDALVLVSDGVANPLRDGPTTVAPALAAALRHPPSPIGLALLADFSRQGCFDDRTVVGLWPQVAGPPDPDGDGEPEGADDVDAVPPRREDDAGGGGPGASAS